MAKIVIDLDGVICNIKKKEMTYNDVEPLPGAVEKINKLKSDGHYIIINTARHMLTTNSNIGLINKKVGKITLDWLDRYGIQYDEMIFAKPHADVYLDDNAFHFKGWDKIDAEEFDDNKINIVIPMAGRGDRFIKAGYKEPKPLIRCHDRYMFEWAVKSFEHLHASKFRIQYIFVILSEHAQKWNLDSIIKKKYANSIVVTIDQVTGGQAETVLKVKMHINNLNKLIIFNVDTYSVCTALLDTIEGLNIDGIIPCFHATDPKYSFAKVDEYNNVVGVAEKIPISNYASNGMYYFRKGRDFVWMAEQMIVDCIEENNEYYVIPVYRKMIEMGKIVKMVLCDENWVIGTPSELIDFQNKYIK